MVLDAGQIVAIVALIVSITALVWSTLQLVHSYLSSAKGYSNINEKVMPGWHEFKRRHFLRDQFRFEVRFETPVLIVCPANNTNFPVRKTNGESDWHLFINGEERGEETKLIPNARTRRDAVHTVNNEQATWMDLLSALQLMEIESCEWQNEQVRLNGPSASPPPAFSDHSLAVAIQRKQRSWDNMPSSITKPFATTTMCHIVEVAAMLGLHWKEFDRSKDSFLAEGNGYVLRSTSVSELGTVFTFQICGKNRFKESRVIPVDDVKELAFGFVSTFFRENSDLRRLEFPADEPRDLTVLQLGSLNELGETLVSFGCNTQASDCIRNDSKRHGHLYPLAFEILGMLGKVLHVEHSFFRMLPNPTFYQWNRQYFNVSQLLLACKAKITTAVLFQHVNEHFERLKNQAEAVERAVTARQPNRTAILLSTLHQALGLCDEYLKRNALRHNVESVLREHIQTVLLLLNPEPPVGGGAPASDFGNLNAERPEDRENSLMNIYFDQVLPIINKSQMDQDPPKYGTEQETNIWCTLVFRSLCWLRLHDFHKNDKQIPKSELMGSRLPVYVI